MVLPIWVFLISLAFNIIIKILTPFLGRFRSGIDSLLFCAVVAAFVGGPRSGLFYGFLIAASYYITSSRRWHHAAFVIPLVAFMGFLAGILEMPLVTLGLVIFFIYHAVSFVLFGLLLKNTGPGYTLFVILNFITTYALLVIAGPYLA